MRVNPICKKDGADMYFNGFASMGSRHSNYYKCEKCGRVVIIYDEDLEIDDPPKRLEKKF